MAEAGEIANALAEAEEAGTDINTSTDKDVLRDAFEEVEGVLKETQKYEQIEEAIDGITDDTTKTNAQYRFEKITRARIDTHARIRGTEDLGPADYEIDRDDTVRLKNGPTRDLLTKALTLGMDDEYKTADDFKTAARVHAKGMLTDLVQDLRFSDGTADEWVESAVQKMTKVEPGDLKDTLSSIMVDLAKSVDNIEDFELSTSFKKYLSENLRMTDAEINKLSEMPLRFFDSELNAKVQDRVQQEIEEQEEIEKDPDATDDQKNKAKKSIFNLKNFLKLLGALGALAGVGLLGYFLASINSAGSGCYWYSVESPSAVQGKQGPMITSYNGSFPIDEQSSCNPTTPACCPKLCTKKLTSAGGELDFFGTDDANKFQYNDGTPPSEWKCECLNIRTGQPSNLTLAEKQEVCGSGNTKENYCAKWTGFKKMDLAQDIAGDVANGIRKFMGWIEEVASIIGTVIIVLLIVVPTMWLLGKYSGTIYSWFRSILRQIKAVP